MKGFYKASVRREYPDWHVFTAEDLAKYFGLDSLDDWRLLVDQGDIPDPFNHRLPNTGSRDDQKTPPLWTMKQIREWEKWRTDAKVEAVFLPKSASYKRRRFNPEGWNAYPDVLPPEGIPFLVAVTVKKVRQFICMQFQRGQWLTLPFQEEPAKLVNLKKAESVLFRPIADL